MTKGANIEARDKIGATALMWAARGGSDAVVNLLCYLTEGQISMQRASVELQQLIVQSRKDVAQLSRHPENIEEDDDAEIPACYTPKSRVGDFCRDLKVESPLVFL